MISALVEVLDLPVKSKKIKNGTTELEKLKNIVGTSKNAGSTIENQDLSDEGGSKLYKKSVESLLNMCRSLMRQGDSLLAIKQIKRFLFTEPTSLESHTFIALLYIKMGNYQKSYDHIMGIRFMTNDSNYDAKIASGSIMDSLIFQSCKLPLGLKSMSLVGYKLEDELPFNDRMLEYMYPYKTEKLISTAGSYGSNQAMNDIFTTPIATQQINVGELVHVEEPYALAPELPSDLTIQTTCFHCLREREVYDHAFGCSVHPNTCPFVFCRWECMIKHSRRHELECDYIGSIVVISNQSGLPISFLLLAMRCLIQTHLDNNSFIGKNECVSLKILDLPSYCDAIEMIYPTLCSNIEIATERLIETIPPHLRLFLSKKELETFLFSLYSNKLPVFITSASSTFNSSPVPVSTGVGLFPKASKFQHSCLPSCVYYLNEENKICLRAAYNIPENSNLTISYISDLYQPTFRRKSMINSFKVFLCMCSRCLDDTENDLFLEGIRCPFCITGFFVPVPLLKKEEIRDNNDDLKTSSKGLMGKNLLLKRGSLMTKENPKLLQKNEDKFSPEMKTLCERARIGGKYGELQTKWKCNNCGEYSVELNDYCSQLSEKMDKHYKYAVDSFQKSDSILSKRLFEKFIENYSLLLHKNHYYIYNSRSYLVGLYNCTDSNDSKSSYKYCKSVVISANKVFPVCYHEKVHLFLSLADIIYKKEMLQKVSQRGLFNNSKELIMECLWLSLFNSLVCYGPKSSIYLYCFARIRLYSSILGVITPPSNLRIRITSIDLYSKLNREILGNSTISKSANYLSTLSEYSALLFIASIKGHLKAIAQLLVGDVKDILLNQVTYLPTGLNLIGMAANNLREDVCSLLIEEGSDLLFRNELGITPLHSLCLFPNLEDDYINKTNDKKSAIIAREMIRKTYKMDNDKLSSNNINKEEDACNNKASDNLNQYLNCNINIPKKNTNRYKLLYSKTIKWLGSNTALHIAAYRGRKTLCSELIHGGTDPNIENIELATPLHLASLNGHTDTVRTLLKCNSNIDKENYQGVTPLLLSIYNLKCDTMKLLLEHGANLGHVSDVLKMNSIHMLVSGLCSNTSLSYKLPTKLDDLPYLSHSGYNNKDLNTYVYSMGTSHTGFGNNTSTKVLSLPIQTPNAELLYISPKEMLIRLNSTFEIITYLNNVYEISPLLKQKDLNGFNPYELLDSMWNSFLKIRNESMSDQGLWYSSLSDDDKISTQELWTHIMQRVERLLEVLRVSNVIYDIDEEDPELELPLPKKEYKGIDSINKCETMNKTKSKLQNNEDRYLVRRRHIEQTITKKTGNLSSNYELSDNVGDLNIKDIRCVLLKRMEDYSSNYRKDRMFKNLNMSDNVKGLDVSVNSDKLIDNKNKLPVSQSKSIFIASKNIGKKANTLLKPSVLNSSELASKMAQEDKLVSKKAIKKIAAQKVQSKTLSNKMEEKNGGTIIGVNNSSVEINGLKKSTLVLKQKAVENNTVPKKVLVLKSTTGVSNGTGLLSKSIVKGAGGIGSTATKVDLSKIKVISPKKIEIKTSNLVKPKGTPKIVTKAELVPKKVNL
ncbi:hypothetical protein FG386_000484 [Cryptosporidium ryanae]|uniref:uncharacterized protein n=1 Tax=Cryptosporidium ryanae TaxID=515981 RepID=UPI00351A5CB9|nr:hypothetical protein FG386_000484 [Cryptosporidium ryanae]